MTQAERIIHKFDGLSKLASSLDPPVPVTTVQGWKDRGFIPAKRQQSVLEAAQRRDIDLTPDDFFDQPAPAVPCRPGAEGSGGGVLASAVAASEGA